MYHGCILQMKVASVTWTTTRAWGMKGEGTEGM